MGWRSAARAAPPWPEESRRWRHAERREQLLTATSTDLATCPRCAGRVRLTVRRFARDIAGTPFDAFLAHHLIVYRPDELRAVVGDIRPGLPEPLESVVDSRAHELADEIEAGAFAGHDTELVLERVVKEAASVAGRSGVPIGDATALDFFEAVVLEAALLIDGRPAVRDRLLAGRRGWFDRYRWSLVAGAAGLFLVLWQPEPVPEVVAWTLLGLAVLPPIAGWVRSRAEG